MKNIKSFKAFEGKLFDATKKPHEKKAWDVDKKEAFRGKVKSHIKSLGCTTKQVGNDLELYCEFDMPEHHIDNHNDMKAQIMFRDDYVGIKKTDGKFTDKFKYDEFGKIKSELTKIIKSCK